MKASSTLAASAENSSEIGQLYVKARREKTTHFFLCKPLDSIESLKRKITMFLKGVEPTDIRLYLNSRLLDDKSNVHDQDVRSNCLIYYKLKKGNGEWEQFPELGI